VGVPVDDVMADYYLLNKATGAPPIVGPPRKRQRDLNLLPWLLLIPLLLLMGGGYYWWQSRPATPTPPAPAPASSPGASGMALPLPTRQPPVAAETTPAAEPEPASSAVEAAAEALAEPAPVAENAARAVAPALASDELALQLTFSGDCWTEVTDSDGERLFFDLGKSGRTVNLRGKAPVRVLLGNSNNVSVRVNGEPYTIAASDRRGDTARMSINR
jgi:cytoskeleton protein RodZ